MCGQLDMSSQCILIVTTAVFERSRRVAFVVCVQSYKKDSPSSGLFRVKVYNEHGMAERNGTGMFPREVMSRFPLLPLEEEGRLNDMPLRENFIERVFAYYRWTQMLDGEPTPGGLVKFHTAHRVTREAGTGLLRAMAPQPILTLGQATTPKWAASSPTPASGTGRN